MDFVIDASIAVAWILEDEQSELADRVIDSLVSKTAAAPSLWSLELANILIVAERRGRIDAAKRRLLAQGLQDLGVVEISWSQARVFGEVLSLAVKHRLSSYDASYLELAQRLSLPLASLDYDLRKAAGAEHVPLWG